MKPSVAGDTDGAVQKINEISQSFTLFIPSKCHVKILIKSVA